MKIYLYSVYDSAVEAFMQPQFFRSKGEAIRAFSDACNDDKTNFYRHAGDYGFYCLGVFDDSDGSVVATKQPERVITGLECLKVETKLDV